MRPHRAELLHRLETVAVALGEDLARVVFVGGAVVALYDWTVDEDVRTTKDIDCMVDVTWLEYQALQHRLCARGFGYTMEAKAPACRLRLGADVLVDVMPIDGTILGFSNPWYREAAAYAETYALPNGQEVRAVSPLYFSATKLDAFKDRGFADMLSSHDLEDVVSVLSSSETLRDTVSVDPRPVCSFIRSVLLEASQQGEFFDALEGHFRGDPSGQKAYQAFAAWVRQLHR